MRSIMTMQREQTGTIMIFGSVTTSTDFGLTMQRANEVSLGTLGIVDVLRFMDNENLEYIICMYMIRHLACFVNHEVSLIRQFDQ